MHGVFHIIVVVARTRKDWGALILIDERYSKGHHYTKGKCRTQEFVVGLTTCISTQENRTFTSIRMVLD